MKKKLNIKPTISRLEVPFMVQQQEASVEIKDWHSNEQTRHDLVFRTINSYVSISLSRKQMILLKQKMLEFN